MNTPIMDILNYRLIVRTVDQSIRMLFYHCHNAKAEAGKFVNLTYVKSVFVYDKEGNHYFYMVKDSEGHVIREKTENVSSTLAKFG